MTYILHPGGDHVMVMENNIYVVKMMNTDDTDDAVDAGNPKPTLENRQTGKRFLDVMKCDGKLYI